MCSKRVYGSGLGRRSRPSAMTRIPGKSFSPQYLKLLNGPLNFGCRRILMICIGLSNEFAINLIMFHQISVVFIMKDKISKFWSISVPRCGSLVVRALGTLPGRSLVRSRVWLLCKKNVNNSWDFISMCGLGQTTAWRAFQKNSNRG